MPENKIEWHVLDSITVGPTFGCHRCEILQQLYDQLDRFSIDADRYARVGGVVTICLATIAAPLRPLFYW